MSHFEGHRDRRGSTRNGVGRRKGLAAGNREEAVFGRHRQARNIGDREGQARDCLERETTLRLVEVLAETGKLGGGKGTLAGKFGPGVADATADIRIEPGQVDIHVEEHVGHGTIGVEVPAVAGQRRIRLCRQWGLAIIPLQFEAEAVAQAVAHAAKSGKSAARQDVAAAGHRRIFRQIVSGSGTDIEAGDRLRLRCQRKGYRDGRQKRASTLHSRSLLILTSRSHGKKLAASMLAPMPLHDSSELYASVEPVTSVTAALSMSLLPGCDGNWRLP